MGVGGKFGFVAGSLDLPSLLLDEGLKNDLYKFENEDIAVG